MLRRQGGSPWIHLLPPLTLIPSRHKNGIVKSSVGWLEEDVRQKIGL